MVRQESSGHCLSLKQPKNVSVTLGLWSKLEPKYMKASVWMEDDNENASWPICVISLSSVMDSPTDCPVIMRDCAQWLWFANPLMPSFSRAGKGACYFQNMHWKTRQDGRWACFDWDGGDQSPIQSQTPSVPAVRAYFRCKSTLVAA